MRIVINDPDDDAGIVATNIIFLGGVLVAIVILRTVLLIRARVYFIYNEILSALRIDTILVSSMVSGEARCVRKIFCACNEREFKKRITLMGKTGTEKPLKAPKKKSKELDDDDLAALARKKEEQAKLNALKKQVAGGGKLGKGLQKSK